MIGNTVIIKSLGAVAAAGVVGGSGYYLHSSGLIKNWFGSDDQTIYLVTQVSEISGQSSANLYNDKVKNYECQFGDKKDEKYDCDILDEITTTNKEKKWINFGDINSETKINDALTKDKLVKDSYFSFKATKDLEEKIKSTTTSEITLIPKVHGSGETDKVFGKLKIIASKKGNKPIGDFQQFLGKAHDVSDDATITATKCQFSDDANTKPSDLKNCSLQIFADTQTGASDTSDFKNLTYKGSEAAFTTSPVKNNYYVVKFTETNDKFSESTFLNKKLIYLEHTTTGNSPTKKKVTFKPLHAVVVHTETNGTQKILVIH